jgi:hypothetical protein
MAPLADPTRREDEDLERSETGWHVLGSHVHREKEGSGLGIDAFSSQ